MFASSVASTDDVPAGLWDLAAGLVASSGHEVLMQENIGILSPSSPATFSGSLEVGGTGGVASP